MTVEPSYLWKAYWILIGLGDYPEQWIIVAVHLLVALPWLLIADAVSRPASKRTRAFRAVAGAYCFSRLTADAIFWAPIIATGTVICVSVSLITNRNNRKRLTQPMAISILLAIAASAMIAVGVNRRLVVWLVNWSLLSALFGREADKARKGCNATSTTVVWSLVAAMLVLPCERMNLHTYLPSIVIGWLGWFVYTFVLWRQVKQQTTAKPIGLVRVVAAGMVGVLAAACLLEIYFRYVYDESDADSQLLTARRWAARHIQLNSSGFRDREFEPLTQFDESLRVVVLGDSFAFGIGVDDAADLFGARLEIELNDLVHKKRVVAFNISRPGICTYTQIDYTRTVVRSIRPHLVVLLYVPNDIGGEAPFKPNKHPALAKWWRLRRSSYALDFLIWHVYRVYYWSTHPYPFELDLYRDDEMFARHSCALKRLFEEIEATGACAFVALHPFPGMSAQVDPQRFALDRLTAFLEQNKTPHIDLSRIADTANPKFVVNSFDAHPNAALMHVTAQATARRIVKLLDTALLSEEANTPVNQVPP